MSVISQATNLPHPPVTGGRTVGNEEVNTIRRCYTTYEVRIYQIIAFDTTNGYFAAKIS